MSEAPNTCDPDYHRDQIRMARQAEPAEIDRAAAGWRAAVERMRAVADSLYGPNGTQWTECWTGRASEEASAGFRAVAERIAQHAQTMDTIAAQLDEARGVLERAGDEARRMDEDGFGEKVKSFFGGGENDAKIATEAYYAMVQGLDGPTAQLGNTCAAGPGEVRANLYDSKTFGGKSDASVDEHAQVATAAGAAGRPRGPVLGGASSASSSIDPDWTPAVPSSPVALPVFSEGREALSAGSSEGGLGGSALAGTSAVAAAAAVAAGGAAMFARSARGLAPGSGGQVPGSTGGPVPGGSGLGAGSRGVTVAGPAGAAMVGGPSPVAGAPVRPGAGGVGGLGMVGGAGVPASGAGPGNTAGRSGRFGPAPQLAEGARRRPRGDRPAVLEAGSRSSGKPPPPPADDDPFYDTD